MVGERILVYTMLAAVIVCESYKDLLYIRRKFIHKDNLRNTISKVVNAIFKVRMQKFGAKEQNLITNGTFRLDMKDRIPLEGELV